MPLLFVYGSLKQGFPNFHVTKGCRIEGKFITARPHPFFLVNWRLPCLLPATDAGLQVVGRVFEITAAAFSAMDELERVDMPPVFAGRTLPVQLAKPACDEKP